MKEIQLTQGKVALVDDGDFESLSKFNWHYAVPGKGNNYGYAKRNIRIDGKKRPVSMHRQIMGTLPGQLNAHVDHIDGNKLNNQRINLRYCTAHQNKFNRLLDPRNKSGFKGVSHSKGRWRARLKLNGREKWLGYFDSVVDAARAYNEAALRYFGEFAKINDLSKYEL